MKKVFLIILSAMYFFSMSVIFVQASEDEPSFEDKNSVMHFGTPSTNKNSALSKTSEPEITTQSGEKLLIIDISYHNGNIDWSKVKGNVDGVIIRIGYRVTSLGKIYTDSKFLQNYNGAKENDIPVGFYFYSYAKSEKSAKEEANWVITILNKNNCKMDYPIYFDYEEADLFELGVEKCTDISLAFCKRIESAGYKSGIYTNTYSANNKLDMSKIDKNYDIWIADWGTVCLYEGTYSMWQFSSTGTIEGISTNVDLNYCYTDLVGDILEQKRNTPHTIINYFIVFFASIFTNLSSNVVW